jgi:hypothetical protein
MVAVGEINVASELEGHPLSAIAAIWRWRRRLSPAAAIHPQLPGNTRGSSRWTG